MEMAEYDIYVHILLISLKLYCYHAILQQGNKLYAHSDISEYTYQTVHQCTDACTCKHIVLGSESKLLTVTGSSAATATIRIHKLSRCIVQANTLFLSGIRYAGAVQWISYKHNGSLTATPL